MPIVRYFVVMGAVLLGLLLLADAKLPAPGPLANSTNFYGLHKVQAQADTSHLTVVQAPAPDMTSAAVLAAEPEPPAALPSAPTAPDRTATPAPAPAKKHKSVARRHVWRGPYADADPWNGPVSRPTRLW